MSPIKFWWKHVGVQIVWGTVLGAGLAGFCLSLRMSGAWAGVAAFFSLATTGVGIMSLVLGTAGVESSRKR